MLRRVKKRFEERGIQLPMAQRTVVHRYARSEADQNRADDEARWNQRKSA
jgi:small-conductance mechanosensitive channel